jgi:hypothetical protein
VTVPTRPHSKTVISIKGRIPTINGTNLVKSTNEGIPIEKEEQTSMTERNPRKLSVHKNIDLFNQKVKENTNQPLKRSQSSKDFSNVKNSVPLIKHELFQYKYEGKRELSSERKELFEQRNPYEKENTEKINIEEPSIINTNNQQSIKENQNKIIKDNAKNMRQNTLPFKHNARNLINNSNKSTASLASIKHPGDLSVITEKEDLNATQLTNYENDKRSTANTEKHKKGKPSIERSSILEKKEFEKEIGYINNEQSFEDNRSEIIFNKHASKETISDCNNRELNLTMEINLLDKLEEERKNKRVSQLSIISLNSKNDTNSNYSPKKEESIQFKNNSIIEGQKIENKENKQKENKENIEPETRFPQNSKLEICHPENAENINFYSKNENDKLENKNTNKEKENINYANNQNNNLEPSHDIQRNKIKIPSVKTLIKLFQKQEKTQLTPEMLENFLLKEAKRLILNNKIPSKVRIKIKKLLTTKTVTHTYTEIIDEKRKEMKYNVQTDGVEIFQNNRFKHFLLYILYFSPLFYAHMAEHEHLHIIKGILKK